MLRAPDPAPAALPEGLTLTAMQADIVAALQPPGTERLAKQIAARTGYKNNSRFRTVLRQLLLAGLVQRAANGYRLPTSP